MLNQSCYHLGCYVDSSRGIYMYPAIVSFAKKNGYAPSNLYIDYQILRQEELDVEIEVEEADEAIGWLNANYGNPVAFWGFNDNGDFGLWHEDEWD